MQIDTNYKFNQIHTRRGYEGKYTDGNKISNPIQFSIDKAFQKFFQTPIDI